MLQIYKFFENDCFIIKFFIKYFYAFFTQIISLFTKITRKSRAKTKIIATFALKLHLLNAPARKSNVISLTKIAKIEIPKARGLFRNEITT